MIYPFPYSRNKSGSVILGRSDVYSITAQTIADDISNGAAIVSSSIKNVETVLLNYSNIFGAQNNGYSYALFPKLIPSFQKYYWFRDADYVNDNWRPIVPYYSHQVYGFLYNWYAATNANIAPTGWHVPTQAEWNELATFGGTILNSVQRLSGTRIAPYEHPRWNSGGLTPTNNYSFNAYATGFRDSIGAFGGFGAEAFFWTTYNVGGTGAVAYFLNSHTNVGFVAHPYKSGSALRFVKDNNTGYPSSGYKGTVTDVDGNTYKTIRIGDQVWTTENFACTKYNNGTPIQFIQTDNARWASDTGGAYCVYGALTATQEPGGL